MVERRCVIIFSTFGIWFQLKFFVFLNLWRWSIKKDGMWMRGKKTHLLSNGFIAFLLNWMRNLNPELSGFEVCWKVRSSGFVRVISFPLKRKVHPNMMYEFHMNFSTFSGGLLINFLMSLREKPYLMIRLPSFTYDLLWYLMRLCIAATDLRGTGLPDASAKINMKEVAQPTKVEANFCVCSLRDQSMKAERVGSKPSSWMKIMNLMKAFLYDAIVFLANPAMSHSMLSLTRRCRCLANAEKEQGWLLHSQG